MLYPLSYVANCLRRDARPLQEREQNAFVYPFTCGRYPSSALSIELRARVLVPKPEEVFLE